MFGLRARGSRHRDCGPAVPERRLSPSCRFAGARPPIPARIDIEDYTTEARISDKGRASSARRAGPVRRRRRRRDRLPPRRHPRGRAQHGAAAGHDPLLRRTMSLSCRADPTRLSALWRAPTCRWRARTGRSKRTIQGTKSPSSRPSCRWSHAVRRTWRKCACSSATDLTFFSVRRGERMTERLRAHSLSRRIFWACRACARCPTR